MAVITISRGTFSGGKELAECVAEKLGYQCVSQEILQEAAAEYGISLERLAHALAGKPGILENVNRERTRYLTCITAELLKHAKDGNLVYHGMAGHLLLREVTGVLRVRVIADMDYRIRAAMEQHKFDRNEAIHFIKKVDASRIKWTKILYDANWLDLQLYDLIVNLHHQSMDAACAITCVAANSPKFADTPESLERRRNFWMATDIKARIMAEKGIKNGKIDVMVDGPVVTLTGEIGSSVDTGKITSLASQTAGVARVVSTWSH